MNVTIGAGLMLLVTLFSAQAFGQDKANADTNNPEPPPPTDSSNAGTEISPAQLLKVPVSGLTPGAVQARPKLNPPPADEKAAQRGMDDFASFNCVGCHMGNGGGGMGPALSNHAFIYGSSPENIFLSIYQGRPNGMPAWGTVLPEDAIWDLVAYIKNLSDAPVSQWGTTTSSTSPAIEQVPSEIKAVPNPWQYTQKFADGQKPQE
ncbi:MAG: c-type cytochrome [Proteobacteria bacterium]|nr:c-type cytochrome [Pseudomonadota bacterium]